MIFITGGTGLVGSHILLKLCQDGISFQALKRKNSSLKICQNVFEYYNCEELFEEIIWINGDVNDIPSLERGMMNCSQVIHAAAIVSFHAEDAEVMNKVNIEGTKNIMNIAISLGVEKICHISSIASLGRNSTSKIITEDCMFKVSGKESNYALSKYYAEQEAWRASQEGIDVVILNPSVILGPGDWTKGSSQIFQRIYKGLKFYTSGSTGYVDVLDVANCAIQLLQSNIKNERFIVSGENIKYRKLFDLIAEQFNKPKSSIKITPLLKEIAWRLEFIRTLFTGGKTLITKESVNLAMQKHTYSTKKIENAIEYKFIPITTSVECYCKWFLSE